MYIQTSKINSGEKGDLGKLNSLQASIPPGTRDKRTENSWRQKGQYKSGNRAEIGARGAARTLSPTPWTNITCQHLRLIDVLRPWGEGSVRVAIGNTLHLSPVEARGAQEAVLDGVEPWLPGRGADHSWGAGGSGGGAVGRGGADPSVWHLGAGQRRWTGTAAYTGLSPTATTREALIQSHSIYPTWGNSVKWCSSSAEANICLTPTLCVCVCVCVFVCVYVCVSWPWIIEMLCTIKFLVVL